ncbi:MAG: hypothetical protein HS105_07965 [Chloracidobacterium sp.]|nr:hypothetical protein [Chloracidobacterium sp.]MCO5332699.1 hypothetical protein [Pyrinomonadaceae bacterium]
MTKKYSFDFISFGVPVSFTSNDAELFEKGSQIIRSALLERCDPYLADNAANLLTLNRVGEQAAISIDGEVEGACELTEGFFKYFDTRVRLLIAERAPDVVFLHSGAIGWNGKVILFPGDSFAGKTTVVAEFLRRGATYYSDEYAVIDHSGNVHPFARKLWLRDFDDPSSRIITDPRALGGSVAEGAAPVCAVMFLEYRKNSRFRPHLLTAGEGLMRLLRQTTSLKFSPKFAIKVLNELASRVTFVESTRSNAKNFVDKAILFIDKL